MINLKKNNQKNNYNVDTCKYNNKEDNCCNLKETEVKNQDEQAKNEEDTICASYELDNEEE